MDTYGAERGGIGNDSMWTPANVLEIVREACGLRLDDGVAVSALALAMFQYGHLRGVSIVVTREHCFNAATYGVW